MGEGGARRGVQESSEEQASGMEGGLAVSKRTNMWQPVLAPPTTPRSSYYRRHHGEEESGV